MAIRVEHELHHRRKSRNYGMVLILIAFVGIVFGLTAVKLLDLQDPRQFEKFDHVVRPQLLPGETEGGAAQ